MGNVVKLPKLTEGDLVEILWHDSAQIRFNETWIQFSDLNWEEEELQVNAIQTVGYYLANTKDTIFLTQTYCANGGGINIFSIPIGCIRVLEKK